MAKRHGTREQKRLAKQNAKRRTRRRELARRESPDPTVRLKDADRWPVSAALVPDELWDMGIGHLVVARRMYIEPPVSPAPVRVPGVLMVAITVCLAGIIVMGVYPEPWVKAFMRVAMTLFATS